MYVWFQFGMIVFFSIQILCSVEWVSEHCFKVHQFQAVVFIHSWGFWYFMKRGNLLIFYCKCPSFERRHICITICREMNARIPLMHEDVAQCWISFVALAGGVGHRASWLACVWPGGGVDSSAQRGEPPPDRTHHRHHSVACCLDISLLCVMWNPRGPMHFFHFISLLKMKIFGL